MRLSLLFILVIIKALNKSRDLFSSFVGFLLSMDRSPQPWAPGMDTFKRRIYDDHLACKRMTPKKI